MKRALLIVITLFVCLAASAQTDRKEVRSGNRKFSKGNVAASEIDYRKALLKDSTSVAANYNLASAQYRQQDFDGAAQSLSKLEGAADSRVSYNAGDIALQKKDYAAAVKAFKESLLLNPGDLDAKENYIYAKKMLENQQNQGGGDGQDQNQDQNQDQQQDQDQNDDQNKDQNQQDQNQDRQDQQPQPQKITEQQAQQMLKAIQAKEKDTQDKVQKEKAELLKSKQKEKNW